MSKITDMKKQTLTQTIHSHRTGWIGVWDALVSAITRKPRAVFPCDYIFTIWADRPVEISACRVDKADEQNN